MIRRTLTATLFLVMVVSGCDLLNPARPTPHDDTILFGNLIEVGDDEGEPGVWWVRIRIGLPRAFARAEAAEGKPTPTMEQGMVADVRVTSDTVVLVNGRPDLISNINPGGEVVVIPVAGTTRMIGTSNISVEAGYITDFDTYRRWQLPGLGVEEDPDPREDPARINSAGVEGSPVPVGDGSVLYFSARLRLPARAGAGMGRRAGSAWRLDTGPPLAGLVAGKRSRISLATGRSGTGPCARGLPALSPNRWLAPARSLETSLNRRCIDMTEQSEELPDFEKALEELEALVEQLESGDLNLEQSLSQFQRGIELTRHCQGVLAQAQQTVEQLIDPDDEASAVPFDSGD